jgi:hypothetical protein
MRSGPRPGVSHPIRSAMGMGAMGRSRRRSAGGRRGASTASEGCVSSECFGGGFVSKKRSQKSTGRHARSIKVLIALSRSACRARLAPAGSMRSGMAGASRRLGPSRGAVRIDGRRV